MITDRPAHRRGITLIEVLVVVVVIGLLVAIILPAVQAGREAARRATCMNNLRQIGLALSSYESSRGSLPGAINGWGYSPFSMILPGLEQTALYDSLNFSLQPPDQANRTALGTSLSVLICPSDRSVVSIASIARRPTNYACNVGYGYQQTGSFNGAFSLDLDPPTSLASFTDGLTNTALMSELVRGSGSSLVGIDRLASAFYTPFSMPNPNQFDEFNKFCNTLTLDASSQTWNHKGEVWARADMGTTLYNHNLSPNSNSCLNGVMVLEGTWGVSSRHPSGANVLFADGHVRFVKDRVALTAWRAAGTRAAGELTVGLD